MRSSLLASTWMLGGCFGRPPAFPSVPALPPVPPAPHDIWGQVAYWGSWAGALAFFAGVICLIMAVLGIGAKVKTGIQLLVSGMALIVSMQLMLWFGAFIKPIAVTVLLAGLVAALLYGFLHRRLVVWFVERLASVDLDGDKKIGKPR